MPRSLVVETIFSHLIDYVGENMYNSANELAYVLFNNLQEADDFHETVKRIPFQKMAMSIHCVDVLRAFTKVIRN